MTAPASTTLVNTTTVQALLARSPDRLPLELALQLAHEVVAALTQVHESGIVLGQLDASALELGEDGAVHVLSGRGAVLAPELAADGTATVASDVFAAGTVLFEIFTGLTPAQARGRLATTAPHSLPPASRFNPTLDESLDELIAAMVSRDPAHRPATMLHVEAKVLAAFDELGLEPAREALVALVTPRPGKRDRVATDRFIPVVAAVAAPAAQASVPAPVVKAAPVATAAVKKPVRRAPPVSWQLEEEEEDEEPVVAHRVTWSQPMRFDAWAVSALGFTVAAFALALSL